MSLRVIISGGGTGGHIYPGICLAYELKNRNNKNEVLFVGTKRGLEAQIIPREGFKFISINAKGIPRRICWESFTAIIVFFISLFQSYKIIRNYRPDIVIGTGGYVSGSIVLIAALLGIPTFIHEQNVIPGITNRFLSRIVKAVFLSFDQSKKYFRHSSRLIFTGNPIRFKKISSTKSSDYHKFKLDPQKKTILVFGGSKGAASINRAVIKGITSIKDSIKDQWQVLLISGSDDYKEVVDIIGEDNNIFSVKPYLYDIEKAYVLADLVICRAGATTLAEISAYGLPAILIPYPFATNNHQECNARILENEKAAILILEESLSGERLAKILYQLINDKKKLEIMSKKSKKLGNLNSAKKIVDFIFDYTKK